MDNQKANSATAGTAGIPKDISTENSCQQLPEINFASFIISLSSSALLLLGEIPDPVTNQKQRNLPLAKQTIDILGLLKEKTTGNLELDENRLLESLLYDLRMRYVDELKKESI